MMRLNLVNGWMVRQAPLDWGAEQAATIEASAGTLPVVSTQIESEAAVNADRTTGAQSVDCWFTADLPCDVRMPLIAAGRMADPVIGDHCFAGDWIENRSWWMRNVFAIAHDPLIWDEAQLVLDGLDAEAQIWLNGVWLGRHRTAFAPFSRDVRRFLRIGENQILVRLTSGLEGVSDADLSQVDRAVSTESKDNRGDRRRAFVRKPQYAFGWDWGPRVATVGIAGPAELVFRRRVAVRGVNLVVEPFGEESAATVHTGGESAATVQTGKEPPATVRVSVEVENLRAIETIDADLEVVFRDRGETAGQTVCRDLLLRSGLNVVDCLVTIDSPHLWWPNGMGEQHLYTVSVAVRTPGAIHHVDDQTVALEVAAHDPADSAGDNWPDFAWGLRIIELDQGRIGPDSRRFLFRVNNVPVFAKGANWIPADAIYMRAGDAKLNHLVAEAAVAGFTMLRVWGGGRYEPDAFYTACDRHGILVWQDLMFACAAYPDHLDWFRQVVEDEIRHQVRRLRHHACLTLWCGNNENQMIYRARMHGGLTPADGRTLGLTIYNQMAPRITGHESPQIPYWNSSPFGGSEPNARQVGDRHHWNDAMMNAEMEKRITPELFDGVGARFVSEYGYPGPCPRPSVERYFGGQPIRRDGRIWAMHTNSFEKDTVAAGIRKHYTDRDLTRDDALDDYLLVAGLTQALMLGYTLEALRADPDCSGALFWMFNDCWGEVGWSIVDYALMRKPSFYAVKRAFSPIRLILRRSGDAVVLIGCNDSGQPRQLNLTAGWLAIDGTSDRTEPLRVHMPAHHHGPLIRMPLGSGDARRELWVVRSADGLVPAVLRLVPWRGLVLTDARLSVTKRGTDRDDALLTVRAEQYAHAVHLIDDYRPCDDAFFDLLPGEERMVRVFGAANDVGRLRIDYLSADRLLS